MGAGQEIVTTYVETGQVKVVFWPILDIGRNSLNGAVAAHCAGVQNADFFWAMHDQMFAQFQDTSRGDRAYFVDMAIGVGADQGAFEACYDGPEARDLITRLDESRRRIGIRQRPTFDIEGLQIFGAQPFVAFEQAIEIALQQQ